MEVNVRATMKEKLGLDFHNYTIIGACNPPLSHRALDSDLEAGERLARVAIALS